MNCPPTDWQIDARDTDGLPVLLRHRVGDGTVGTVLPNVDETIAQLAANRPARDRWLAYYRGLLELAGH